MGVRGNRIKRTVNVVTRTRVLSGSATLYVNGKTSAIGFEGEGPPRGTAMGWFHLTVFNGCFGPGFTSRLDTC